MLNPTIATISEMEQELGRLGEALGTAEAREILELFLEDSGPRLETLSRAVDDNDPVVARREAHSLKGAAGNLGAESISRVCAELEQELGEGDWNAAHMEICELRRQLGAVLQHFGERSHAA